MGFSLGFFGDDMPGDEIFKTRVKHGHMQGLVAPIKYTSVGSHSYTGLFKGGVWGYARISESGFM